MSTARPRPTLALLNKGIETYPGLTPDDAYLVLVPVDHITRRIASEWHGGQNSRLYSFSSTGTLRSNWLDDLARDLEREIDATALEPQNFQDRDVIDLFALYAWIQVLRADYREHLVLTNSIPLH